MATLVLNRLTATVQVGGQACRDGQDGGRAAHAWHNPCTIPYLNPYAQLPALPGVYAGASGHVLGTTC